MEDTALLENGRGASWHGSGMAWARHGMCELALTFLVSLLVVFEYK
jgi:hypothetical protein